MSAPFLNSWVVGCFERVYQQRCDRPLRWSGRIRFMCGFNIYAADVDKPYSNWIVLTLHMKLQSQTHTQTHALLAFVKVPNTDCPRLNFTYTSIPIGLSLQKQAWHMYLRCWWNPYKPGSATAPGPKRLNMTYWWKPKGKLLMLERVNARISVSVFHLTNILSNPTCQPSPAMFLANTTKAGKSTRRTTSSNKTNCQSLNLSWQSTTWSTCLRNGGSLGQHCQHRTIRICSSNSATKRWNLFFCILKLYQNSFPPRPGRWPGNYLTGRSACVRGWWKHEASMWAFKNLLARETGQPGCNMFPWIAHLFSKKGPADVSCLTNPHCLCSLVGIVLHVF